MPSLASWLVALVPVLAASVALAHHGVSQYDMQAVRTLEGVVERWEFGSPHTWLTLTVPDGGGTQTWEIEGAPPRWMTGQGWTPRSLVPGERVAVMLHPHRRTPNAGILMEVTRADGEVLKVNRPASLGGP